MSAKTVQFKTPGQGSTTPAGDAPEVADKWVAKGEPKSAEPMKRFTIDVPKNLHARIKSQCAMRDAKMADVIRALLEREFPPS